MVSFYSVSNAFSRTYDGDRMPRRKFSISQLWEIRTLIKRGTSFSEIRKDFKKRGLTISKGYLSKLKHLPPDEIPTGKNRERRTDAIRKLKAPDLESLRKSISVVNPPTQAHLAKRFGCSTKTIRNAIKRIDMRLVTKPKCHALSEKTIEKRRKRSRPLYRRLCNERWRRYVTSDEAWVYLSNTGGKRSVQYISRDSKRSVAEPAVHVEHPRGVMVWVAISADGVSRPLFIRPGAKIDATYYQKNVLQPFFKRDPLWKPSRIFHQDSAPSHKAKSTLRYLDEKGIKYIKPQEWTPSSPDCAPCDFFLWGYLKSRLNKRKPKTVTGLQKAIRQELRKIPQGMINNALRAWPKRLLQVHRAGGCHIERFRA